MTHFSELVLTIKWHMTAPVRYRCQFSSRGWSEQLPCASTANLNNKDKRDSPSGEELTPQGIQRLLAAGVGALGWVWRREWRFRAFHDRPLLSISTSSGGHNKISSGAWAATAKLAQREQMLLASLTSSKGPYRFSLSQAFWAEWPSLLKEKKIHHFLKAKPYSRDHNHSYRDHCNGTLQ
jgi:hypothetical protein